MDSLDRTHVNMFYSECHLFDIRPVMRPSSGFQTSLPHFALCAFLSSVRPTLTCIPNSVSSKHSTDMKGETDAGDEGALWIVKPSDSSRGRGVYLLRELGELAYDRLSIVQRWKTSVPAPATFWGWLTGVGSCKPGIPVVGTCPNSNSNKNTLQLSLSETTCCSIG